MAIPAMIRRAVTLKRKGTGNEIIERWADLSKWTVNEAGKLEVSAGKLFSKGAALPSAVRPFAVPAKGNFRMVGALNHANVGTAGKYIEIGVSTSSGAGEYATGGHDAWFNIGIDIGPTPKAVVHKGATIVAEIPLEGAAFGDWLVTIVGDANYVSLTLTKADRLFEFRYVFTRAEVEAAGPIKNIVVLNQDAIGAGGGGSHIKPLGGRTDLHTLEDRAEIEVGVSRSYNTVDSLGHKIRLEFPGGFSSGNAPTAWVLFAHGVGDAPLENTPMASEERRTMFKQLLEAGYAIASTDLGGSSVYGNETAGRAMQSLYEYVNANWLVTAPAPVVLSGFSGGATAAVVALTKGWVPADILLTIEGFVNVKSMFDEPKWGTEGSRRESVKTAYGIPAAGTTKPTAKEIEEHIETPALDPVHLEPAAYDGVPVVITHSAEDTTLTKGTHADTLKTLLLDHQAFLKEVNTSGNHATAGNFPNLTAFLAEALKHIGGGVGGEEEEPPEEGGSGLANKLMSWGLNAGGNLGLGYAGPGNTGYGFPQDVPVLSDVVQVAAADEATLLLKGDGTVWAVGKNNSGQLGTGIEEGAGAIEGGTTGKEALTNEWIQMEGGIPLFTETTFHRKPKTGPEIIFTRPLGPVGPVVPTIVQVSMVGAKSYLLTSTGRVLALGSNAAGYMSNGWYNVKKPLTIENEEAAMFYVNGEPLPSRLSSQGILYGQGTLPQDSPWWVQTKGGSQSEAGSLPLQGCNAGGKGEGENVLQNVVKMVASKYMIFYLTSDRKLWFSGILAGEKGAFTKFVREDKVWNELMTERGITSVSQIAEINASDELLMVRFSNGEVAVIGQNKEGMFGDGTTTENTSKRKIAYPKRTPTENFTNAAKVVPSQYAWKILDTEGNVWTCGSNREGQQGIAGLKMGGPEARLILENRGAYKASTAYKVGDLVVETTGVSYRCKAEIKAGETHAPPNGTYWELWEEILYRPQIVPLPHPATDVDCGFVERGPGASGGDTAGALLSNGEVRTWGKQHLLFQGSAESDQFIGTLGNNTLSNKGTPQTPIVEGEPLTGVTKLWVGNSAMFVAKAGTPITQPSVRFSIPAAGQVQVFWDHVSGEEGQMPTWRPPLEWQVVLKMEDGANIKSHELGPETTSYLFTEVPKGPIERIEVNEIIRTAVEAWKSGTAYKVGDSSKVHDTTFRCKKAHTSAEANEPPDAGPDFSSVYVAGAAYAVGAKIVQPGFVPYKCKAEIKAGQTFAPPNPTYWEADTAWQTYWEVIPEGGPERTGSNRQVTVKWAPLEAAMPGGPLTREPQQIVEWRRVEERPEKKENGKTKELEPQYEAWITGDELDGNASEYTAPNPVHEYKAGEVLSGENVFARVVAGYKGPFRSKQLWYPGVVP